MSPILVPTLAELDIELGKAKARYDAVTVRWNAGERSDEMDELLNHTADECIDIASAIAALPAASLEHLRIKARALTFGGSYLDVDNPVNYERLIAQILTGLLDERIA